MQILLINNDGAGFADHVNVAEDMTLEVLFLRQCPGAKEEDYLIRVNRQPAARDQRLVEGDRVSITPRKIEGAGPLAGQPTNSVSVPEEFSRHVASRSARPPRRACHRHPAHGTRASRRVLRSARQGRLGNLARR